MPRFYLQERKLDVGQFQEPQYLVNTMKVKYYRNEGGERVMVRIDDCSYIYLLQRPDRIERKTSFFFQDNSHEASMICTDRYDSGLNHILKLLGIGKFEGVAVYKFVSFNFPAESTLIVATPKYGENIYLKGNHRQSNLSIICNLFKYKGHAFYFIKQGKANKQNCHSALVLNSRKSKVYGIAFQFPKQGTVICLPFIHHQFVSALFTNEVEYLLQKTCYLSFRGNYCTGFFRDDRQIITAKHLLPVESFQEGISVKVRAFPYTSEIEGVVSASKGDNIDLIEVAIKLGERKIKEVKQFDASVGQEVMVLGFGKYNFGRNTFEEIDMVLPTLEKGIVSKMICMQRRNIFLKTDADLYNGFSGCAIWKNHCLIGMAVFILRNKTSQSNFTHHNFSYTADFIRRILSSNLPPSLQTDLQDFDAIQTRKAIPWFAKL